MKHDSRFIYLDLLRGMAAMMVFVSHVRRVFFVDYSEAPHTLPIKLFYFFTGLGHQAVIVFFVLSGFFISRNIYLARTSGKWSVLKYTVDRLSRLWTVLLPALLLTVFWDVVGSHLFKHALIYAGKLPRAVVAWPPTAHINITTLVGNACFLNTILVNCLGSNTPLWSLANEFWYYVLFPLFYFSWVRRYSVATRLCAAMLAIVCIVFVSIPSFVLSPYFAQISNRNQAGIAIPLGFIIWLMGGIAAYLVESGSVKKFINKPISLLLILCVIAGLLIPIRCEMYSFIANDYSLGTATLLLVAILCYRHTPSKSTTAIIKGLSNLSYTLYLVHLPLAIFFSAWLAPFKREWLPVNVEIFTCITIVILLYAAGCWWLFEGNTGTVRSWALKRCSVLWPESVELVRN